jgi:hypothetical protein
MYAVVHGTTALAIKRPIPETTPLPALLVAVEKAASKGLRARHALRRPGHAPSGALKAPNPTT